MVALLNNLNSENSTLVLLPEKDEAVEKSARNLSNVTTIRASYLNVRDLLGHEKVVLPVQAVNVLQSWLGNGSVAESSEGEEE